MIKGTGVYGIWVGMRGRCLTITNPAYHQYGGRGITVCARWNSFKNFAIDMGERPIGYTLERKNNDGNYCPENCKWATHQEQQRNRRNTVKVIIEGKVYLAIELAEKYGFKTDTIVNRAKQGLNYSEVTNKNKRIFKSGLALGGIANGIKNRMKTHCPYGHEYTLENTGPQKNNGRYCKECKRIKQFARYNGINWRTLLK